MQHKNAAYFKRVEDFIEKYTAKHAVSPTSREIAEGTVLSPATVCRYMKVMRDENVLEYSGIRDVTTKRQREIRVNTSAPIPVLGAVSCGVPKFAEENIEEYVTLPISLFGKGNFFILRANGDSMKGAGISNLEELRGIGEQPEDLQTKVDALSEELESLADKVKKLIQENAKKAMDQTAYDKKYNRLISRYEKKEEELQNVTTTLAAARAKNDAVDAFIEKLRNMDSVAEEFDEDL